MVTLSAPKEGIMTWDHKERRRREQNYRLMFRVALAFFALGVALTLFGAIVVASEANTFFLGIGLLFTSMAGMSAYLSVRSTAKIIDLDENESSGSWRDFIMGGDR